jgi:hypothetical protein
MHVMQARKCEDPRFKDIKAVAKPANSCDSSVCPDPEPVPGFQPRSTWMAGQRASASPTHSAMAAAAQVGTFLGSDSCTDLFTTSKT